MPITPAGLRRESTSGRIRESLVYLGTVKKNDDPQRMGRLWVWIPELGGDPNDERSWFIVSYASPFAGVSSPMGLRKDDKTMAGTQTSYGFWGVPPDLENQVLLCFVNGDPSRGFWFACVYQQNMNHMVPGIAINKTTQPEPNNLAPVTEYNKWSAVNPDDPQRPIFGPLSDGLVKQGLTSDSERGPTSTSARREAPSHVIGLSTPRGNHWYIDDHPKNEAIRLRTRSGVQIVISETTGFIYMSTKEGNSWMEISDAGVDVYSKKSISMRAEENINLRADKAVNIDAGTAVNLRAGTSLTAKSGAATVMKAGGEFKRFATRILDNVKDPESDLPKAQNRVDVQGGGRTSVETIVDRMPSHEPWPLHPRAARPITAPPSTPPPLSRTDYERIGSRPGMGSGGTPGSTESRPGKRPVQTGSGTTAITDRTYEDNSAKVKVGTKQASESVISAIREASDTTGMDFGYMMAKADMESSFDPNVRSKTSSATGLYQFTDGTWKGMVDKYGSQYGIDMDDRTDPRANAIMGALYARENKSYLENKGHDVGNTELYMAHFLGAGGANKFLSAREANGSAPAYTAVSEAQARANYNIFYDKASGRPKTIDEVYGNFQNKIEPKSQAYQQYRSPAPAATPSV